MDEKMREQTRGWALQDVERFVRMYELDVPHSKHDKLPEVPFSAEQIYGMRADSYGRGYRAGYLRFIPPVTVGMMDAAYALRNATICRDDPSFRPIMTRGPSWACFMPAPFRTDTPALHLSGLERVLAHVSTSYALPTGCVSLPNMAELMFLFLMERVYDLTWPHGRTLDAISSTVIGGRRLGLHVSHDDRMRLSVTMMPVDGPFEGNVFPIAYPPSKQV